MLNNVLGTLKYDITAGALSLVVTPISATTFNLPPGGTDATGATTGGTPTYGKPIETLILADRLDLSQAKYEVVQATVRAPEAGGAYTYTILASGRGAEGSTATAWTATNTVYVFQAQTAAMIDLPANGFVMRSQAMLVHSDAGILSWDGTTFKYSVLRAIGAGRGSHASSSGYIDLSMPANGTVAIGYGGAANCTAASGGWPLAGNTTLYYEMPLASDMSTGIAGNYRVVSYTSNFVVPPHWLLIATRANITNAEGIRVATGAHLPLWHSVGGAGEPAFANSWVQFSAAYQATQFSKSDDGWVTLRGLLKDGTVTAGTTIFTLPAGFRPGNVEIFPCVSNSAFAALDIQTTGQVRTFAGVSLVHLSLAGIRFQAAA